MCGFNLKSVSLLKGAKTSGKPVTRTTPTTSLKMSAFLRPNSHCFTLKAPLFEFLANYKSISFFFNKHGGLFEPLRATVAAAEFKRGEANCLPASNRQDSPQQPHTCGNV